MPHVRYTALIRPLCRALARVGTEVRAFGKDEEPHGVQVRLALIVLVLGAELLEAVGHAGLVGCPLSGHEDEAVELHGWTDDGDPFERLFEDDIDVAVEAGGVGYPPEIQPVGVDLVVGDEDEPVWEFTLDSSVFCLLELTCHGFVA